MIDEFNAVRELRPSDPAEDPAARASALRALRAVTGPGPEVPARRRRPRRVPGAFAVAALATIAALLVAGGALVLLHGRRTPAPRVAGATAGGRIVAPGGGTLLARSHGRLHITPAGRGLPLAGVAQHYGKALRGGDVVRLGTDAALQRAGDAALAHSVGVNGGSGGAFVAMNPDTGQVLAVGSLSLRGSRADRAIADPAPVGATFTPITALAALGGGRWTPGDTYDDTGTFCTHRGVCRRNAGGAAYGVIDMVSALRVSDSVFFDNLGALLNSSARYGGWLQEWASTVGLGRRTGIDLPGEAAGSVPAPDTTRGPWKTADNVDLAVGQGADLRLTPLQLAVAYAALADGLRVPTPHLAASIDGPRGTVVRRITAQANASVTVGPTFHAVIDDGLHDSAQSPGGTSADVMGSFPLPVDGKAGTAQALSSGPAANSAWYACFVPASATHRPIVVVVRVDGGGFGDVAAAPVARQILSQWFLGRPGPYRAGSSATY